MEMKKSLTAAITTAVYAYISSMESQQAMAAQAAMQAPPPPPQISMWAVAGRQSSMEMRRMFQLRLAR